MNISWLEFNYSDILPDTEMIYITKRCTTLPMRSFRITMTSQWARWRLKSPASRLFTQPFIQAQVKKNIRKLRVTDLCEGNSPVAGEFPAQMASNAENVSIWWRHQGKK